MGDFDSLCHVVLRFELPRAARGEPDARPPLRGDPTVLKEPFGVDPRKCLFLGC
jgi:hypothetical protein